jgi:hypothetical protein
MTNLQPLKPLPPLPPRFNTPNKSAETESPAITDPDKKAVASTGLPSEEADTLDLAPRKATAHLDEERAIRAAEMDTKPRFNPLRSFAIHLKKHPRGRVWYLLLLPTVLAGLFYVVMTPYVFIFQPDSPTLAQVTSLTQLIFWGGNILFFIIFMSIQHNFRHKRASDKYTKKMSPEERIAFPLKQKLLMNERLVEFYAPSRAFTSQFDPNKKKPRPLSKGNPFKDAIDAAWKRRAVDGPRSITNVKAQIAAVAANITVLSALNDDNELTTDFFIVKLNLAGNDEKKVEDLGAFIKSELNLYSVSSVADDDYSVITFECHKVKPVDKLMTMKVDAPSFFAEHPCTDLRRIPLAVTKTNEPWSLPTHHTLIFGATGSGKGSVIQGVIRQLAPHVLNGTVRLFGVDPKLAEFKGFRSSTLFDGIAFYEDIKEETGMTDIEAMIDTVYQLMKGRQESIKINLSKGDLGRSVKYSRETPLTLLVIDEFSSMMKKLSKESKDQLYSILAQGRSGGVFVLAATQNAEKSLIGDMRVNFANAIVLRIDSKHFNDLFLGEGAAANGFDATKIPVAGEANNFASAGIAYVQDENGVISRVRFAYSSDKYITQLIQATLDPEAAKLYVED